jgi:HAE1 family hydrophobic/amphiphilic exporter-1
MKISQTAVRRSITTMMAYVVAIGFGLFSLSRLGLDMYPDVSFPLVGIITTYEGAAPEDIEQLITRPLEEAAASVEGVKKITSESKQGASVIFVEFDWGADVDQGELDIRKSLEFVRDYLPPDASNPLTFAFNPSMQPVMFILVSGNFDQATLRRISERQVEPRLERVPGVAAVDTMGGLEREIQVRLRPERLRTYRVSAQEIISTLQRENLQLPAGSFEMGAQEFLILSEGRFQSVDEIRDLVITYRQAGLAETLLGTMQPTADTRLVPVRLRDLADVEDTFHEASRLVEANGDPAVFLVIRKQSGENTVRTVQGVKEALPEIQELLPGVKFQIFFDQSEFIEQSLGNLSNTGLTALGFAFLVLLFFLASVRGALVVGLAIPISIVVTFAAMDQLGLTLNILSMAGLMLAIGMLVDNAIVVLENITRLVDEEGMSPREAAMQGAGEVGMAITASTLTTVAVFAPIPFVPGIAGLLFRDMAITIVVSLFASLVVALTLVPVLAAWMLGRRKKRSRQPWYERLILGLLDLARSAYVAILRGVLRFRWVVLLAIVAILVVSIRAGFVGRGFDFFPKADQGLSVFTVSTRVGTNIDAAAAMVRRAEEVILAEVPEVELVSVDLGVGQGFTAIFGKGAYSGTVRVKYKPRAQRARLQKDLEQDIVERVSRIPGLEISVMQMDFLGSGGDIAVKLFAEDLELLREVGLDLAERFGDVPGIGDVEFSMEEGKPEYRVRLARDRMASLGVPAIMVTNTLQTYFQGVIASRYRERGEDYNIFVRAPRGRRIDLQDLLELPVATLTGKQIPLHRVADIERATGPTQVTRENQRRMVTLALSVPGEDLGGVTDRVEALLRGYRFPPDFSYTIGGTAEDLRDTQRYMGIAVLVALLLVYMVMAAQFESLLSPFIIFFTMPLAVIGVALAFVVTGMTISVPAIIGIVILIGVVVNNGIVLVDRANQSHYEGKLPLREAVLEAGRMRFRPVLMTALTTILGMLPLAAEVGEGSENWAPMGRVIIGGLISATFLTLFVVPALYLMIVGFVERWEEHGMIRLVPKYAGFLAFVAAAGAGVLTWLAGRPNPPEIVELTAVPGFLPGTILFAGLMVATVFGVRSRAKWGWFVGVASFGLMVLAGAAAAGSALHAAGGPPTPETMPGIAAGAVTLLLGLVGLVPLVRRRVQFGVGSERTSTVPPPPPAGAPPPEDGTPAAGEPPDAAPGDEPPPGEAPANAGPDGVPPAGASPDDDAMPPPPDAEA